MPGGYHDVKRFRETLFTRLLVASEYELYVASGLVQEEQYAELFDRYVQHVSVWVKKERLYNRVTQRYEEPGREDDGRGRAPARLEGRRAGLAPAAHQRHRRVGARPPRPEGGRRRRSSRSTCGACARRSSPTGARPSRSIARDIVLLVRDEGAGLDAAAAREARGRRSSGSSRASATAASAPPTCASAARAQALPRSSLVLSVLALSAEVRRLALPAIAQSLLQTLVFVVDRVMLGHHGEASLAAMQIAGPLEWSLWSVFSAFTVGTVARVGRHVGAGERGARAPGRVGVASRMRSGRGSLVTARDAARRPLRRLVVAPDASPATVQAARSYLAWTLAGSPLEFVGSAAIADAAGRRRHPDAARHRRRRATSCTSASTASSSWARPSVPRVRRTPARASAPSLTFTLEAALATPRSSRDRAQVSLRRDRGAARAGRTVARRGARRCGACRCRRSRSACSTTSAISATSVIDRAPRRRRHGRQPGAHQRRVDLLSLGRRLRHRCGGARRAEARRGVAPRRPAGARSSRPVTRSSSSRSLGLVFLATRWAVLPLFSSQPRIVALGASAVPVLPSLSRSWPPQSSWPRPCVGEGSPGRYSA